MIYLIAFQTYIDPDRPHWLDETVNEDYGYFTTREEAQAFADQLDSEPQARYAEKKAAYDKAVKRWDRKQARAAAQGFSNPDFHPSAPEKPLPHVVVGVKPHESSPEPDGG